MGSLGGLQAVEPGFDKLGIPSTKSSAIISFLRTFKNLRWRCPEDIGNGGFGKRRIVIRSVLLKRLSGMKEEYCR